MDTCLGSFGNRKGSFCLCGFDSDNDVKFGNWQMMEKKTLLVMSRASGVTAGCEGARDEE